MMEFAKLLRSIANGNWPAGAEEDEHARLRAENLRLKAAVDAAVEALAAAPLWHAQHRVANNILADVKEELEELADRHDGDLPSVGQHMH